MAVDVGEIRARLVAQDDMSGGTNSATQSILAMAASFGTAQVATQVLTKAYEVLVGLLKESVTIAASVGTELGDLSKMSGMAAGELSEMRYVADTLGQDLNRVSNASFMMAKQMNTDGPKFIDAVHLMGLSVKEFASLSQSEQLYRVSDALRATSDYATQVAISTGLMGQQGRNLLPLLLEPIRELREEYHRLGLVITEENIKASEDFESNLNRLNRTVKDLKISVGNDLIPKINELVEKFADRGFIDGMMQLFALANTPLGVSGAIDMLGMQAKIRAGMKEQTDLKTELTNPKLMSSHGPSVTSVKDYDEILKVQREETANIEKMLDIQHQMHLSVEQTAAAWERSERAARQHLADVLGILNVQIKLQHDQMMMEDYSVGPNGEYLDEQEKAERAAAAPFEKRIAELRGDRARVPDNDIRTLTRIDQMIESEQRKMQKAIDDIREQFARIGSSADKAAESVDGFRSSLDRAVGKTTPGGSSAGGGNGAVNAGATMNAMDWQIYNASVNAALYGKGNSAEINRIIYAPTLFPGQSYTPRAETGSSGGGLGINITQNYPISSDQRSASELQRLIQDSIAEAMRRQGLTVH